MSFSVIGALVLLPVLLAPWYTHRLYDRLHELEKAQIAVDNAAITLGRRERQMFRLLETAEKELRRMELAHHPLHVCGQKDGRCRTADLALEAKMVAAHRAATVAAQALWTEAALEARARLAALDVVAQMPRPGRAPFRERRCLLCLLPVGWTLRPTETRVTASGLVDARVVVRVRRREGSWDYRLAAEDG